MTKKILLLLLVLAVGLGLLLLTARRSHYESHRSLLIKQPSQRIWQLLADIDGWPSWWPGVERARLIGPLAVGSRIDLKLKGLPEGKPVRLEVLLPQRQLGWSGRGVLGSRVATRVELRPAAGGCVVLLGNSISGPQAVLARFGNSESFSQYQELVLKILASKMKQAAAAAPGGEKD